VPVCHGTASEVSASPRPLDYPVFVKPVGTTT
jgi:hypothetical protein